MDSALYLSSIKTILSKEKKTTNKNKFNEWLKQNPIEKFK